MKNKYNTSRKDDSPDTDTKSHSDENTFYSQSNTGSVGLYLYPNTK
jgi:hypothetical protein